MTQLNLDPIRLACRDASGRGTIALHRSYQRSPDPAASCFGLDLRVEWLRVHTLTKLAGAIEGFGDKIGATRRKALDQLVTGLVEQAYGINPGRFAYAMPCGGGKTQAAVALIASAHELGTDLTFAVCASQVSALCLLKRDLMGAGVPEKIIGLRHSMTPGELDTALAGEDVPPEARRNTGDEDREIMLVTHSRIRGANGASFATHKGKPRSLMIWDEALLIADAGFVSVRGLIASVWLLDRELSIRPALKDFLTRVIDRVRADRAAQKNGAPPSVISLPEVIDDAGAVALEAESLPLGGDGLRREAARCVWALARLAGMEVSLASAGNDGADDAIIHYAIRVSRAWKNIAVLDAGHVIGLLTRAGDVIDRTTREMLNCRDYTNTTIRQFALAAGKTTQITGKGAKQAARHAARIIASIPAHEHVLLFVFKDAEESFRRTLADEGVDLDEKTNGKRRIIVETWGREAGTNAYGHCEHVILVGLFRRNVSQLVAALAGEADDLLFRRSGSELEEAMLAQMARNVQQAMHRGACRRSDAQGRARRMTLHIIDRETRLRDFLADSLPGARWEGAERPAAPLPARTILVVDEVLAYLAKVPPQAPSVSIRAVRAAVSKVGDAAWKTVIGQVAVPALLAGVEPGWAKQGRSLIRTGAARTT